MIGVVVGQEHRLAGDRLAVAPGDARQQIGPGIFDQRQHRLEICWERFDGIRPCGITGRLVGCRPIPVRPIGRFVLCIAAELEDVVLGDAEVLEEAPGGVRGFARFFAAKRRGEIGDGIVEGDVGVAAFEHFEKVVAQEAKIAGTRWFGHGS